MSSSNYLKLHYWVRKKLGRANYCSNNRNHKSKRYDWANISGEYRKDILDYKSLCRSCHEKQDYTEERRQKVIGNHNRRISIKKIDKEGNIIKIYNSIKEAAIESNILNTSIENCLKGRSKTAGRWRWSYVI